MVLDLFAGVSISALKPVTEKVSKALVAKVNSKLNPSDLEKALQEGLLVTQEWEEKLPQDQRLFYRCLPDLIPRFLAQFFQETTVQQELQKPLTDAGTPKVEYLVEVFQKVAQTDLKGEYITDSLEPWLEVFTQAYLQQTSTYLKFQVAKEDYFQQLAIYFDDIKFAGIAVEGQEREKSERLEQIFVMPEVKEETTTSPIISDVGAKHLGENLSIKPKAYSPNTDAPFVANAALMPSAGWEHGRKFSAEQLLSQTTAKKLVILGNPGIGKTTLMSYFAVMLARKQPEKLGLTAQVDWLPILLRIRDLARVPDMGILEFIEQFTQKHLSVATLPTGFFEHWLQEGKALILLDGLDEVANPAKREEIVDKIRCFLGQFQMRINGCVS
ncbi:MAG: NACHT domain-containing protein [Symploca sp. SIO1C2]|nr:NACHT domain-containing protein [Symploca sp. SIO1C2]